MRDIKLEIAGNYVIIEKAVIRNRKDLEDLVEIVSFALGKIEENKETCNGGKVVLPPTPLPNQKYNG